MRRMLACAVPWCQCEDASLCRAMVLCVPLLMTGWGCTRFLSHVRGKGMGPMLTHLMAVIVVRAHRA